MFPGATTSRDEAGYVIVGAPLDVSTSFEPRTRFGPREIRHFAESFEDYDHRTNQCFSDLGVYDSGDLRPWDDTHEYIQYLSGELSDVVVDDAIPLLLGGEHTVSVAGVRAVDPSVYVCLDAHLDLRDEYAGNKWSHATVTNHVLDVVDEVILVGVRSGSEAEWERVTDRDVTVVRADEVHDWEGLEFGDDQSVYLSVDIDVVDPSVAPATGTKEPFGLSAGAVGRLVRHIAPYAVGFDVVEVNDMDDGQTAVLGAKLVHEFVFTHSATSEL